MYNKVFKNYQVNVGSPFQVRLPMNLQVLKSINTPGTQNVQQDDSDELLTELAARESKKAIVMAEELLQNAREEAELIIKEAHYEAERIMQNAEVEARDSITAVREEAAQQGYDDGYNQAMTQYQELMHEAETIKQNAAVEYDTVMAGIESDAVNMILEIAKKVIGQELSINKENLLYLVKQAIEKCSNKENIIIRVSAEDYEYLEKNKDNLLSMVEGVGDIEIKRDASLKDGSCILETLYGSIDAGANTKIKKIEEVFKQLLTKKE